MSYLFSRIVISAKLLFIPFVFYAVFNLNFTCNFSLPVKILEKRYIMKENKAQYVKRERDVMSNLDHPFFVKLYFTFQDDEKLCIL